MTGLEIETAGGLAAAAIQAGTLDTGASDDTAAHDEPVDVDQGDEGHDFDGFDSFGGEGDFDVADTVAQLAPELDKLEVPDYARPVVVEQAEQMFEQMIAAGVDEQTAFVESLTIATRAVSGAEREWAARRQEEIFRGQGDEIARVAGVSRINHADALESAATKLQNMTPEEIEGLGGDFRAATFAQVDAILEQKHGKLTARDRVDLMPFRHSMVAALERQADAKRNPPAAPPRPRDDQGRFARSFDGLIQRHFGPQVTNPIGGSR